MKTKRFISLLILFTITFLFTIVTDPTNVVRAKNNIPIYHFDDVSLEIIPEMITQRYNMKANSHARPPIVLVHGWRGLDEQAPCLPNAPDPSNYPTEYWLHLDEDLVERGFDVTFAKLITGSGTDGSIPGCTPISEDNVPYLMTAIDNALAANPGQDKVILIAHSMGGLVSRAYLESDSYRGDVVELYTLGTPHLGVPISGVVKIIESITFGSVNLKDFCTSQPVVCQFADDEALVNGEGFTGIATFNDIHNQRREGVHYHLIGGDVDFGDRSNLGVLMDAFVSNDWPMSNQSNAPENVGGWAEVEAVTQIFNNTTGLAYWGLEYPNLSDLDLANGVLPDPSTFWRPWRPDTGTSHDFSITYAVPASMPRCPGSPFVGLSMDQSQRMTMTAIGVGDLIDHSLNETTVTFGGYRCPEPVVKLDTTVGTDDTCSNSDKVNVPKYEQDVTFCYTLTNDSPQVAVIEHTLTDTLAFSDPITQTLLLAPGASHTITASTTLSGTQDNCYDNNAEWKAVTDTGFGQLQGNDANTSFVETAYQTTSRASATVCVGTFSIYLPSIMK